MTALVPSSSCLTGHCPILFTIYVPTPEVYVSIMSQRIRVGHLNCDGPNVFRLPARDGHSCD